MLYISHLAQKSLQHAERTCDEVWFISGRYGLLRPDQEISSYDDNSPIEIHYYGGASKVRWLHVLKGGIGQRLQVIHIQYNTGNILGPILRKDDG